MASTTASTASSASAAFRVIMEDAGMRRHVMSFARGCPARNMTNPVQAAQTGYLDMFTNESNSSPLVWPEDEDSRYWVLMDVQMIAARHGRLSMVRWVYEAHDLWAHIAPYEASRHGHLDVLKYLHSQLAPGFTPLAVRGACIHGSMDMIRFWHQHYSHLLDHTCVIIAVENGHNELIKFLLGMGIPYGDIN